jgi:FkbM family methyltransferase
VTVDPLEQSLAVSQSPACAAREAGEAYRAVAASVTRVVIVGCGHLGMLAFAGARRAGVDVVAFADNDRRRWDTTLEGVPVLSPVEAVARHNDHAFFVVAIYNGTPVRQQISDLGGARVVPYPLFFWQYSDHMPEEDRLELPHRILPHAAAIRAAYDTLSDERSKTEYAAQIEWRCTLNYQSLPPPDSAADMYFDPGIVALSSDEVFVDCGAFDGDSIRLFLKATSRAFRHILAIEPDPDNRARLDAFISTMPRHDRDRIAVLPFGVGDRNQMVSFDASGTVGSRLSTAHATTTIECRRLDDLLRGQAVTFVKMDIEGAEPDALRGLVESMRRARPILAVCAYHKCEHLWTLPPLMRASVPDYHIYLRRYAEECWETVYYAVPPERLALRNRAAEG